MENHRAVTFSSASTENDMKKNRTHKKTPFLFKVDCMFARECLSNVLFHLSLRVVQTFILMANYPVREPSCRWTVLLAKFPIGELSCRRNVLFTKCPVGKMSCRRTVLSANCPVGELSVGEVSVYRTPQRCTYLLLIRYVRLYTFTVHVSSETSLRQAVRLNDARTTGYFLCDRDSWWRLVWCVRHPRLTIYVFWHLYLRLRVIENTPLVNSAEASNCLFIVKIVYVFCITRAADPSRKNRCVDFIKINVLNALLIF